MTTSIVDAESVLAVDIGSIHTRALLFDVVDGQYRLITAGVVSSTAQAPFYDVSEGVYQAIKKLQEMTGREFFDPEGRLILPSGAGGNGIDQLVVTYSAGPAVRMVIMGLLEDVSLESANRLASALPAQVLETVGLNDRRRPEAQIDAILKANPELILLVGGTDGGATRSVARLVELLGLALQVLPKEQRPEIMFAGNQAIAKAVQDALEPLVDVKVAPNLRPGIDQEDLGPTLELAARTISDLRARTLGGLHNAASLGGFPPVYSGYALGRMARFLSRVYDRTRGVLAIDLGASGTTIAAARQGKLAITAAPYGLGTGLLNALPQSNLSDITQWLPLHVQDEVVRDYLFNKAIHPATLPATDESLAIESAMTRRTLRMAVQELTNRWPNLSLTPELILAGGQMLTQAGKPGQSLLTILDGIQPVGICNIVLDTYGLMPALGALAESNTLLPVQIIESNAFLDLGRVIAPVCQARYGTPVLKVRLEYDQGDEAQLEIKQGSITMLPLRPGQAAKLHLQPLKPMIIDPLSKDKSRVVRVIGGACGAVIDMRGRPLDIPGDDSRRRDMIKRWMTALS